MSGCQVRALLSVQKQRRFVKNIAKRSENSLLKLQCGFDEQEKPAAYFGKKPDITIYQVKNFIRAS